MSARKLAIVSLVAVVALGCSPAAKVSPGITPQMTPGDTADPNPPATTTPVDPNPPVTTTPVDPNPPVTTTPVDPNPPVTTTPVDPNPPITTTPPDPAPASTTAMASNVKIAVLHHSVGGIIYLHGVPEAITTWNGQHGKTYQIVEINYPNGNGGYSPVLNDPYDYWNLWINHQGTSRASGELNLEDLTKSYDVIVWKHCFLSGYIDYDTAVNATTRSKSLADYKTVYGLLKTRMKQFPHNRFVVWTLPAMIQSETGADQARRASDFVKWVRDSWDVPGDNIYVWDFRTLEAGTALYLPAANASSDSHPNATFATSVAPALARRIIDVIEGRGDTGSITGK